MTDRSKLLALAEEVSAYGRQIRKVAEDCDAGQHVSMKPLSAAKVGDALERAGEALRAQAEALT